MWSPKATFIVFAISIPQRPNRVFIARRSMLNGETILHKSPPARAIITNRVNFSCFYWFFFARWTLMIRIMWGFNISRAWIMDEHKHAINIIHAARNGKFEWIFDKISTLELHSPRACQIFNSFLVFHTIVAFSFSHMSSSCVLSKLGCVGSKNMTWLWSQTVLMLLAFPTKYFPSQKVQKAFFASFGFTFQLSTCKKFIPGRFFFVSSVYLSISNSKSTFSIRLPDLILIADIG